MKTTYHFHENWNSLLAITSFASVATKSMKPPVAVPLTQELWEKKNLTKQQ